MLINVIIIALLFSILCLPCV